MHRKPLLSLLQVYRVQHPEEAETIGRLALFIKTNPRCFDRQLEIGHITGSAWLVNRRGLSVLLTHHRKLNRWLQLGGHADNCSDIKSVAMREACEESGLKEITVISEAIFDIDIHSIPERGDEKAHKHYDVRFTFQVTGSEAYSVSDESHDLCWVQISDLENKTEDESLIRMKKKWLAGKTR